MATKSPDTSDKESAPKRTSRKTSAGTASKRTSKKSTAEAAPKKNRTPRPSTVTHSLNDGMLNVAVRAAIEAGKIQIRAFGNRRNLSIAAKSSGDFVTEVDKACEQIIIETLSKAYPDHRFLGEENGSQGIQESEYEWIIDPLDGTTNFIHGIDQFAVSIACKKGKHLMYAVVYDPCRNQLFTASKGKGAFLDGQRIRVSNATILRNSLIGTGFPFREGDDYAPYMNVLKDMMQSTCGLRRPGSAALDLCFLACGRYDGFFEKGIKPWDIAAGALIAQEAGALVTDFSGEGEYLSKNEIIAAAPGIFPALINIIERNLKK